MPEARSPPCAAGGWQDRAAVSAPRDGGKLAVIGGIDLRSAHWVPGKPREEHAPHRSFDKNNH